MSSRYSLIAGRLTRILFATEQFTVMPELTVDASQIDLAQFNLKAKSELFSVIRVYTDLVLEFSFRPRR